MNTSIQSQGFQLTEAIEASAKEHVGQHLHRMDADITSVDVFLSDVNGPRGGDDKRVVMRATIRGLTPVTITANHADLYRAISKGAKRLKRAAERAIARRKRVKTDDARDFRRSSWQSAVLN